MGVGLKVVFAVAAAVVACLVPITVPYAQTPQIDWQVEHRFRLFRYQSDFELHRIAYDYAQRAQPAAFATDPILTMERTLNDPAWLAAITGSAASNLLPADRTRHTEFLRDEQLAGEARAWRRIRGGDTTALPRFGWAAQSWNRTCWDAQRQTYKGCARQFEGGSPLDGDYLTPRRHLVTARLHGAPQEPGAMCRWTVDRPAFRRGQSEHLWNGLRQDAPCDHVELFVTYGTTLVLSATLPDGTGLEPADIEVQDLLVASLGDSFSSGEGNPDLPVQMGTAAFFMAYVPEDDRYSLRRGISPRQDWSRPASWFDRRCHRSLYSHHVRAALLLALRSRQKSVTYLGLGCSGAEITEGLLSSYSGKEDAGRIGDVAGEQSQMRALMYELCGGAVDTDATDYTDHANSVLLTRDPHRNDRSFLYRRYACPGGRAPARDIDLLFLSIGINDIGFSPLLADAILEQGSRMRDGSFLTNSRRAIAKLAARAHGLDDHIFGIGGRTKLANLAGRYALMREELARLPLHDGDEKRIVATAYPDTGIRENPCDARNHGMTVFGEFNPNQEKLNALASFTGDDVAAAGGQTDTLYGMLTSELSPYSIATGHRGAFAGHGFCAFEAGDGDPGAAEFSHVPYGCQLYRGRNWETCSAAPNGKPAWRYFNPFNESYPYKSRRRWIRTINDAYQFVNFFPRRAPFAAPRWRRPPSNPTRLPDEYRYLSMGLGGPFHPTAEGHAVVGDALAEMAVDVLQDCGQLD